MIQNKGYTLDKSKTVTTLSNPTALCRFESESEKGQGLLIVQERVCYSPDNWQLKTGGAQLACLSDFAAHLATVIPELGSGGSHMNEEG